MIRNLQIATEFSPRPYGRYPSHGPDNGERFREEVLLPLLRSGQDLLVDLDGARGLGPSFLEEAFGGLIRAGYSLDEVRRRVKVKSEDDPSYITEIEEYLEDEARRSTN